MKLSKAASYLVRKSDTTSFFLRTVVPFDLVPVLKKREFLLSLQTGILKEAKQKSRYLYYIVQQLFKDLRDDTMEDRKELTVEVMKEILRDHLKQHKEHTLKDISLKKYLLTDDQKEKEVRRAEGREKFLKILAQKNADNHNIYDDAACTLLNDAGYEADKDSPLYEIFRKNLVRLYDLIKDYKKQLLRGEGDKYDYVSEIDSETQNVKNQSQIPVNNRLGVQHGKEEIGSKTVSYFLEQFIEHQKRQKISDNYLKEIKGISRAFLDMVGDMPITTINQDVVNDFEKLIYKYPKNRNKVKEIKDRSLSEILLMDGVETLKPLTIKKYVKVIKQFFWWLEKRGYIEKNYASSITFSKSFKGEKVKRPFTDGELIKMFDHKSFLPHATKKKHEARYWVTIIGLFTGARIEQIAQLLVEDIKTVDGIDCFDFNIEDDKTAKNEPSIRLAPIHPTLKQLGFFDYINAVKQAEKERLFPYLTKKKDHGYQRKVGDWFRNKYLTELGLSNGQVDFHSFRRTLMDNCKKNLVNPHLVEEYVGHDTKLLALNLYPDRYPVEVLFTELIKKIDFKFIDWKALKRNWTKYRVIT